MVHPNFKTIANTILNGEILKALNQDNTVLLASQLQLNVLSEMIDRLLSHEGDIKDIKIRRAYTKLLLLLYYITVH